MASKQNIVVSGIQPTGRPHVGNYFGAMRQFVELQKNYEGSFFIADFHALTSLQNPKELKENIIGVALDYLAIGLDPKKATIYKQSDVPQVTELAWIFDCLVTVPYLMRGHAFKDAEAKGKEVGMGVLNYPVLMAADILIQNANVVPVGQDQRQHLEITRELARKFNSTFGDVLTEPKELILENVQVVPGTDGRKMSKSYKNTIPLFADDEEIKKAVMSIPTDSKGIEEPKDPETDNVFALHKLFTQGPEYEELHDRYVHGGIGYKESKEILIRNITTFIAPLRDKRANLEQDREYVLDILEEGGKRAKEKAESTMEKVREAIGIHIYNK